MIQIMKKTANIWEHKVGINAIIANFVFLWKCRMNESPKGPNWTGLLNLCPHEDVGRQRSSEMQMAVYFFLSLTWRNFAKEAPKSVNA